MTTSTSPARQLIAIAAAGAGVIHLAHTPAHLADWAPLGIGFAAAGIFQLALAGALLMSGNRRLLALGAVGSLSFVAVWAVSRTIGLPFGPASLQREAVGRADLLCVALELVVAGGALLLLRRPRLFEVNMTRTVRYAITGVLAAALVSTTGVALASPAHTHASDAGHAHQGAPHGGDDHADGTDHADEAVPAADQGPAAAPYAKKAQPKKKSGHSHKPGAGHDACGSAPVASGEDRDGDGADDGVQKYFRCALHEAHAGHER